MEGPLGKPPYEKPSIAKGVTNFVLHRFTHLPPKVRVTEGRIFILYAI